MTIKEHILCTFFHTQYLNALLFHFRLLSAIPYLVNILGDKFDASNLAIVFPDESAWKRFRHSLRVSKSGKEQ